MDFGGWLGGKCNGEGIQLVGSSWAKKNDCSEIESLWYVVVPLFVHMYRQFEVVVLQCVELDVVYDLVLNLRCLLVISF